MASDTISKLRDAIKEIEQGRVVRENSAALPRSNKRYEENSTASFENTQTVKVNAAAKTKPEDKDLSPDSAFKRIVKLVSVRDRCSAELIERLKREDYPMTSIEEALERAMRVLIVDDLRFAEQFIRGRITSGKGSAGVERELAKYNINVYDVPGWPYEFFNEDDEFDRALSFLRNHPPRSKNPRESAYRKLVQKGYSADIASSVTRTWWEDLPK